MLYLNKTAPQFAWLSPAITVEKKPPLLQEHGTPLLDVAAATPPDQELRAVAGNDGQTQQSGVKVQLWALAFSTATAPSLYLGSAGGQTGRVVPAGAGGHAIDAGLEVDFSQRWDASQGLTSASQEIIDHFAGGSVHCCIYANVVGDDDPASKAITNPSDPAAAFDPAGNRHHAQRNMIIKPFETQDAMDAPMFMANPAEDEGEHQIQVIETSVMKLTPREIKELAQTAPGLTPHREFPLGIAVDLGEGDLQPLTLSRQRLDSLELQVDGVGSGRELATGLAGHETRRMRLRADLGGTDFSLRVFDVVQHTAGGKVVGGARVTALAVPRELLRRSAEQQATAA